MPVPRPRVGFAGAAGRLRVPGTPAFTSASCACTPGRALSARASQRVQKVQCRVYPDALGGCLHALGSRAFARFSSDCAIVQWGFSLSRTLGALFSSKRQKSSKSVKPSPGRPARPAACPPPPARAAASRPHACMSAHVTRETRTKPDIPDTAPRARAHEARAGVILV
jgi:hypothetical protein